MSDFLNWLYDHYIHPQIENQPREDGDEFRLSLLLPALTKEQQADLACVCRFYAVQGFRAGVRFGAALGEDLK